MLQQDTRNVKNDSKLKQNYPCVLYDNIFLFGNTHYSKVWNDFLELVFYVPVFLPFSYWVNKKLVGFIDISE